MPRLSLAEAVTRGEPRSVRSLRPQCWFFPLARVCPAVMPARAPHHRGLRLRCVVRIDVHGSKDRVKDIVPWAYATISRPYAGCIRFVAHADGVPLLGALRTSAVIGAPLPRGDTRCRQRTDQGPRSDDAPRRAPPSRRPGCLSPSRHAKESLLREGIAPSGLRAGSLAHAARTWPTLLARTVLLMGIARSRCGHPRVRDRLESTGAFFARWDCRAWA
jgi:hypothetical protein